MSKYPLLDEILNVNEKNELKRFNSNNAMKGAVKKVMLSVIYYNGTLEKGKTPDPTRNSLLGLMSQSRNISDEQMGQVLRGQMEGITYLEQALEAIDGIVKPEEKKKEIEPNMAR